MFHIKINMTHYDTHAEVKFYTHAHYSESVQTDVFYLILVLFLKMLGDLLIDCIKCS